MLDKSQEQHALTLLRQGRSFSGFQRLFYDRDDAYRFYLNHAQSLADQTQANPGGTSYVCTWSKTIFGKLTFANIALMLITAGHIRPADTVYRFSTIHHLTTKEYYAAKRGSQVGQFLHSALLLWTLAGAILLAGSILCLLASAYEKSGSSSDYEAFWSCLTLGALMLLPASFLESKFRRLGLSPSLSIVGRGVFRLEGIALL
ncbi:MAG TPA: hypothetical protein VHC95_01780 [Opitutales bacterium]|nr:hypothetical protein [Opitutales bacterium]